VTPDFSTALDLTLSTSKHFCIPSRIVCMCMYIHPLSMLQCVAVCCSVLQCVAVCCSVPCSCISSGIVYMCMYIHPFSMLQCVALYCRVMQCVAVHCSVLQCVAVYCSVLQCVAVYPALVYPPIIWDLRVYPLIIQRSRHNLRNCVISLKKSTLALSENYPPPIVSDARISRLYILLQLPLYMICITYNICIYNCLHICLQLHVCVAATSSIHGCNCLHI